MTGSYSVPSIAADPGTRGRLALAIAEAVDSVGGVRLTGGSGIPVSTQYAGGRVVGVRLGTDEISVHIAAERVPLSAVVDSVHVSVQRVLDRAHDTRKLAVFLDDIDLPALPRKSA